MSTEDVPTPRDPAPIVASQPAPFGGVVHTYLGYDPQEFPPPTRPPSGDAADAMLDHMLM